MRNLIGSTGSGRMADDFIPVPLSMYWVEASSSPTLIPIPEGAKYVIFSFPDGNYGVAYGSDNVTAEIPGASGIPDALDDWNPSQRLLPMDKAYMSIVSDTSHNGMLSCYS
jgi:hypothetical protein